MQKFTEVSAGSLRAPGDGERIGFDLGKEGGKVTQGERPWVDGGPFRRPLVCALLPSGSDHEGAFQAVQGQGAHGRGRYRPEPGCGRAARDRVHSDRGDLPGWLRSEALPGTSIG